MSPDEVEIVIRLQDLQAFISGSDEAQASIRKIGTAAKESGSEASSGIGKIDGAVGKAEVAAKRTAVSMGSASKVTKSSGGVMSKVMGDLQTSSKTSLLGGGMGTIGALLIGGISVKGIKDAVESTEQLAKSSVALHQATGMSTQSAASWNAVMTANGVSSKQFNLALKSTATQIAGFEKGTKANVATMGQLGIGMSDVKKHGGDMNAMMGEVIDKFDAMKPGVDKTQLATKLFGRNWQQLLPVLSQGSGALAKQRQEAEAMGVTVGGSATKNAMKLHEAQVQLSLATQGLKVQFAENLAPALITVVESLLKVWQAIAPVLMPAVKILGNTVGTLAKALSGGGEAGKAFRAVLAGMVAGFLLLKGATMAANIQLALNKEETIASKVAMAAWKLVQVAWTFVTEGATAGMAAFNAVMEANPIGVIIVLFVALIAVVVLVITHFKQIKAIILDAWAAIQKAFSVAINFIINLVKKYWPLLVVMFGGPIGLIILAFTKFKTQTTQIFQDVLNFVKGIPGKIGSAFSGVADLITKPFKDAWNWISKLHIKIKTTHIGPVSVPSGISVSSGQFGGVTQKPGPVLIGEAGPELMNLPRGARITPLPNTGSAAPAAGGTFSMPPIYVSVQVDRKEIAKAVKRGNDDINARK